MMILRCLAWTGLGIMAYIMIGIAATATLARLYPATEEDEPDPAGFIAFVLFWPFLVPLFLWDELRRRPHEE